MKFNCGLTPEDRRRRKAARAAEWKDKFAFLPISIASGDCRWLETVQVRRVRADWFGGWLEYRPKQQRGDE